jgi:hypothetical protein
MTRRSIVAWITAAALTPLTLAACTSTAPRQSRPAATAQGTSAQTLPAPAQTLPVPSQTLPASAPHQAATPPATPSGPPLDLHSVNWPDVPIPGQFCGVPGTARLKGGTAAASSSRWGQVQLNEYPPVIYGNLGGSTGEIAAINVWCTVGFTADAQRADSYIVFTGTGRKLTAIGAIVPQEQPAGVHVSLISQIAISPGTVTEHESWYQQNDPTCCPSGRATTAWKYANGQLTPGTPDVTS